MILLTCGSSAFGYRIPGAEAVDVCDIEANAARPASRWLVLAREPAERRRIAARIEAAGGRFATVVEPGPRITNEAFAIGEGTYLAAPSLFSSRTSFGRHVIVEPNVILAHDCVVGDFVTIHASASVAGHVVIEDDVVLESGAVVPNGRPDRPLVIGRGARVRAGAVVLRSVPPGAVVSGNPGRIAGAGDTGPDET